MKIPYGLSNFASLRTEGYFYADKTPFIPELENAPLGHRYVLLLRPRRFGKSLLLSMLEHYYDVGYAEQFDALFGGLWVHEHPTPERSRYLALTLDFSPVATDAGVDVMRRSFASVVKNALRPFLARYAARYPALGALQRQIENHDDAAELIGTLLSIVASLDHKLYLLIDEYDNFANRLLASGEQALHETIVGGMGFVRSFYAALKAGTRTGALARMFITGVSPILLDDLSSGFNILTHASLWPQLNGMAGFTRRDVERALDIFVADRSDLVSDPRIGDRPRLLSVLEHYYNGYRFSPDATERVFNSDLILYFLSEILNRGRYPEQMLDLNVRTDYGRLRRLATLSGTSGDDARLLLETMLTEEKVSSRLVEQFGSRAMYAREQLISLFYYMGMLTFGPPKPGLAVPELVIPNRVIRELQWDYLAFSVQERERITLDPVDLENALSAMAMNGDIQPLVTQFREQVVRRLGSKDLRQFNEKVLKLMLLAYISRSRIFRILSEKELSGGYCDLFLGLSEEVPSTRFAWMLEVKYLKTAAKPAEIEAAFTQAQAQLARYASDTQLLPLLTLGKELKAGALVFVGAKDIQFRPWPPEPGQARRTAKKAHATPGAAPRAKRSTNPRKPQRPAKKARARRAG